MLIMHILTDEKYAVYSGVPLDEVIH